MSYFNGERIEDDFQQKFPKMPAKHEERTFTLSEMIEAYMSGFQAGSPSEWDKELNGSFMQNYFKQTFNIDIPKQQ